MDTIIVGVDGSAPGTAALDFAIKEAALRGARLRVICAWRLTAFTDPGGIYPPEALDRLQDDAKAAVDAAIKQARELQPGLSTQGDAIEGRQAHILTTAAQEALNRGEGEVLLVVGNRSHSEFAGRLLGLVVEHVVRRAPCPVTVVHSTPTHVATPPASERSTA
jgi:nucleotide-binding universal stress UspA family protein